MEFALVKSQLIYYVKQVATAIWQKAAIAVLWAALVPHAVALQGLLALYLIDFGCGLWVARRTRTISSSGMRRGVAKLFIYFIFISTVALCESSITKTEFLTATAIGLLAATEVLSVTENLVLLGLPVPFAAKFLSLVSHKAGAYGIPLPKHDQNSMSALKDILNLIDDTVPTVKDDMLRDCLRVYIISWYQLYRSLDEGGFAGSPALVSERLRTQMEQVLVDARMRMVKDSVPKASQEAFMTIWNKALLAQLFSAVQLIVDNDKATPGQRLEQVREQIVLMLYRIVHDTQVIDNGKPPGP